MKTWRSPSSAYMRCRVPTTFFFFGAATSATPQTIARNARPASTTALWGRLTEHPQEIRQLHGNSSVVSAWSAFIATSDEGDKARNVWKENLDLSQQHALRESVFPRSVASRFDVTHEGVTAANTSTSNVEGCSTVVVLEMQLLWE